MIAKLEEYLDIFHEEDFHDIVISAKIDRPAAGDRRLHARSASASTTRCTWASRTPGRRRRARSARVVPLGHLLASGIGDTIRISYASDPVYEVRGRPGAALRASACGSASAPS